MKITQKAILFIILLLAAGFAFAAGPKVSKDLANGDPKARVDVIVQYKHAPTELDLQKVRNKGGKDKAKFSLINAAAFSISVGEALALAQDDAVSFISPDRPVKGSLDYSNPTVNAGIAQKYGWNGLGIGVAIIDSGINYSAPDLKPAKSYAENFVTWENVTDDLYGHGTHVAGIIAGNGSQSSNKNSAANFIGIAPAAKLINLRVLDRTGQGTDSAVIAAIQRAVQLKNQYNIGVINLSLGRPVFESYTVDPLCQAVEAAWQAGIVVVVAAGNSGRDASGTKGYATISSPGNDPYVITVGAMKTNGTASRADDTIASYSSKGPTLFDHVVKPDLVAPGNRIVSLYMTGSQLPVLYPGNIVPLSYYLDKPALQLSSYYFRLSGTSMATPMVSGAAALMIQRDGTLTPDAVKARLMKTATKSFPTYSSTADPLTGIVYTSQYDLFTIGAGYLDVWAALNSSDAVGAGKSAQSPIAIYDPLTGKVRVVNGTSLVWGDAILWGSNLVWGSSVIVSGTNLVWGDSMVWGSSIDDGFNLVWGDSLVWGDALVWGDSTRAAAAIGILIQGEN
jgi:serine protease AprX